MSEFKPFKGHFEYFQKTELNKVFSEQVWNRMFKDSDKLLVTNLVHNNSPNFNIPYSKSSSKISLDLDKVHSTYPKTIGKEDYIQSVEFKIDSKPIEVLQIKGDEYTFSNDKSEVHTITLNSELILKRH